MFTQIKSIINTLLLVAFIGMAGYIYFASGKINRLNNTIENKDSNIEYYQKELSGVKENKQALLLTIRDLEYSNDSLLVELDSITNAFDSHKKKKGDIYVIADADLKVSDTIEIENNIEFRLDTLIAFNKFTKSYIKIDSTGLINTLDISINPYLAIYPKRVYVRKRKNKFDRLIHLDYKKKTIFKYDFKFNNEAIKTEELRVVIIDE